jgi:Flp pilus assembly protein TadB
MSGERTAAIRDDMRCMRESVSRENLEERLEGVVDERPAARSFLEPRPLAIAVGIAAVLTLIVALLLSVQLAALVLVLSFFVSWVMLSRRNYDRRRPTRGPDSSAADAEDGEAKATA